MSDSNYRCWETVAADALRVARGYLTLEELIETHNLRARVGGVDRPQVRKLAKDLREMGEPAGDLAAGVLEDGVMGGQGRRGKRPRNLFAALAAVEEAEEQVTKPATKRSRKS